MYVNTGKISFQQALRNLCRTLYSFLLNLEWKLRLYKKIENDPTFCRKNKRSCVKYGFQKHLCYAKYEFPRAFYNDVIDFLLWLIPSIKNL